MPLHNLRLCTVTVLTLQEKVANVFSCAESKSVTGVHRHYMTEYVREPQHAKASGLGTTMWRQLGDFMRKSSCKSKESEEVGYMRARVCVCVGLCTQLHITFPFSAFPMSASCCSHRWQLTIWWHLLHVLSSYPAENESCLIYKVKPMVSKWF